MQILNVEHVSLHLCNTSIDLQKVNDVFKSIILFYLSIYPHRIRKRYRQVFIQSMQAVRLTVRIINAGTGWVTVAKRMDFRKSSKGGGSFSIQNIILQILDLYTEL